jgi:hypothetical protein
MPSQGKGAVYIITIVVFSLVYNINKFFEVGIGYMVFEEELVNEEANVTEIVNVTKAIVQERDSPMF